eukprot:5858650-Amphidinium_carterae.1
MHGKALWLSKLSAPNSRSEIEPADMRRPNSVSRAALVFALFCRHLGLNAAFSPRDRAELKAAVDEWIEDSTAARAIYGEIGGWDVSQ